MQACIFVEVGTAIKDLEAMKAAGIGGALIGNINPSEKDGKVPMLSEDWWSHMVHAVNEGKRIGVDIGVFNCPGWSQSGGPWVKPEMAMRYLTYSEISVAGGKTVTTNSDLTFDAATVIWTAGVQGAMPIGLNADSFIARVNRIKVNSYNQVEGYNNIFAIGDIAVMMSEEYPQGHPMMAQPAMQQGRLLAENLIKIINKKEPKPFEYKDKGSMATIGRNKAVVDLPKFKFSGVFAWFVWMFVHLFSLIGFKNKAVVFLNWVYNYIRFDREARLIMRPFKKRNQISFTSDEV